MTYADLDEVLDWVDADPLLRAARAHSAYADELAKPVTERNSALLSQLAGRAGWPTCDVPALEILRSYGSKGIVPARVLAALKLWPDPVRNQQLVDELELIVASMGEHATAIHRVEEI